jgi:beta-galactosidase
MKQSFLLILLSFLFQFVFAQTSSKKILDFDHGWELYRIEDTAHFQNQAVIRKGTTFASQFNYDVIAKRNQSADSIVNAEITEALQGYKTEYPKIATLKWEKVALPCPARYEEKLNPGKDQFVGICYYRKKFVIPADIKNKLLSIKFDGAMQVASVWVNGKFVMQHQGGYLPFSVPLKDTKPENEIIVRLDNRDNPNTPPGKPLAKLGFLYWSGIYRDAWLIADNSIHITDPVESNTVAGGGIFVRYENVSDCSATILIKTEIENSLSQSTGGIKVKQTILDKNGKSIQQINSNPFSLKEKTKKEAEQNIVLKNPRLWSPDNPYLYQLITEVWLKGNLVDKKTTPIGIRTLSYSRWEGFKLNGKPLRIVGTNRHQDHPFIGNALSDNEQYRDLKRIKEAGMNFVRLAHYPNDPSVYDICDSLGIMVADPIPGWQFFNNNILFKERVFRDIRQMIRRDRNHSCVIMWEASLNESYPPDSFRIRSSYIAHEEYPGNQCFTSGDIYGSIKTAWDVPYNGWEDPFGRPQDVQPERPGFVREYGDYEFGGSESTTRVNRSNGEKDLLANSWNFQWEHNLLRGPEYYPWTIGDANWAFFDGFEAPDTTTSDWGVMDVYRIPKFSYYFFRSQMDNDLKINGADNKPMIFIANWWAPRDTTTKVIVYSNCDEVALYINNKLIKKQKPDNGPDSPYGDWEKGGNSFDGGNSRHLQHPPFTFTDIKFEKGELKAVGYIRNKVADSTVRRTPEQPDSLHIEVNFVGKPLISDGADVVFVYVSVTDKNGTVNVLDNSTQVQLEVSGAATIVSPAISKVRGGIASFLIRSKDAHGLILLKGSTTNSKVLKTSFQFYSKKRTEGK